MEILEIIKSVDGMIALGVAVWVIQLGMGQNRLLLEKLLELSLKECDDDKPK